MDMAYKVMLFGLAIGIFCTILTIIKLKIIDPRAYKKNEPDFGSLVKGDGLSYIDY
ncbi:MAG: hypothetical protein LBO66_12205 [Deltaproteobacteria bacterium]|jgi:hypothetical protein|nr:hypothetical protein [Deltaproteobacteria bacterium]